MKQKYLVTCPASHGRSYMRALSSILGYEVNFYYLATVHELTEEDATFLKLSVPGIKVENSAYHHE